MRTGSLYLMKEKVERNCCRSSEDVLGKDKSSRVKPSE